jgi:oligopeptide transport system substrate-binding protein
VWLDILRNKSFLLTTDSWNMSYDDPVEMLGLGVTGDPNNDAGWSSAAYDEAFARLESAPNHDARRAAILECERIIAEEVPYAPVYFLLKNVLVHPAVKGWTPNPLQRVNWAGISLER